MIDKKRLISFSIIVLFIFFLDQITKKFVIEYFNTANQIIYVTSFLNFDLIWNEGIAFGLFGFDNPSFYNIITIIIGIVILVILYFIIKTKNFSAYFYLMIMGGALGNFSDRIRFSAVPDFIDFHIQDYHWFVFNIADIFITLGVICLISDEIFINKKRNEY